ncbi:MAG: UDP-galactopyranose mutase [Acetobacteraceae bacterium]|nr:UDP-galactopyranose mutase [Acetobacteraceae bacterium]
MRRSPARRCEVSRRVDTLVVGAGYAGAVMAERLASDGRQVLVVDRRPHIAGNAFDHPDAAGVLIHPYGPHIFHTNAPQVVAYLSRFTEWRPYEHRVRAVVKGMLLPIPINRTTVNRFFGLDLARDEVANFLAAKAVPIARQRTAADVVLGTVGQELYEAFFRGYTRKQWGVDPSELDSSVTARVPTRVDDEDRYFTDSFQAMPLGGYTRMFEAMLDHPNITVHLGVDFAEIRKEVRYGQLVYTGPIDEYFGYRYGRLPYRSLRFQHVTLNTTQHQPVAVVNYPSPDVPYTRITEFKHLTGQHHAKTSICFEYPSATGDPYYPVPRPENAALYARYRALADATPNVVFVGRLATYRYYNMDQVVGQALATHRRMTERLRADQGDGAIVAIPAAPLTS